MLCSSVFPFCFFPVVDLWLSLLVQHDKDTGYHQCASPIDKKTIFTYRKSFPLHVISGLPQEHEEMRSRAFTYLAPVIDHVGLIEICFSTAATVLHTSEKEQSTCFGCTYKINFLHIYTPPAVIVILT